jgi:hypothetical protein
MMSLPRRQFNLIGITDPVYRFGQSGGRNPRGERTAISVAIPENSIFCGGPPEADLGCI